MTQFQDTDLANSPYYDDFDKTKNFIRIMFNPSRAVQARELSQLQRILQNQVTSVSNHIFKNGSAVIGGEVTIDYESAYIVTEASDWWLKVSPFTALSDIPGTLINRTVRGLTSNALGTIIRIETDSGPNPVQYRLHVIMRGGTFSAGEQLETENYDTDTYTSQYTTYNDAVAGTGVIGAQSKAIRASVEPGIVYVAGDFVQINETDTREIFVTEDTTVGVYYVGFLVNEEIIDSSEDSTLLDPANGSLNYGAPGADRYKVSVQLASYASGDTIPDNFLKVATLDDTNPNKITRYQNKVLYADILNMLARRTFDESGNYTTKPFKIEITDSGSQLVYNVSPGKAYVEGFEIEKRVTTKINVAYPRDSKINTQETQKFNYGYYIDVTRLANSDDVGLVSGGTINWFDVNKMPSVKLFDQVDGDGTLLNTAKVIYARRVSGKLRLYLSGDNGLSTALPICKSITDDADNFYANIDEYNPINQPLYDVPIVSTKHVPIKNVTSATYYTQHVFTGIVGSAAPKTLTLTDSADTFTGLGTEILVTIKKSDGTLIEWVDGSIVPSRTDSKNLLITDLPSGTFDITVRKLRTAVSPGTKTLVEQVDVDFTTAADGSYTFSTEVYPDILDITSIIKNPLGTPVDVTIGAVWSTGQTDLSYNYSYFPAIADGGTLEATTDYRATLYRLTRSTSDYFTPSSYDDNGITYYDGNHPYTNKPLGGLYENLRSFTNDAKTRVYNAYRAIDFRRDITEAGDAKHIVEPSSDIHINYEYYLPRIDRVWLSRDGNMGVTTGISANIPGPPPLPEGAMTLFLIHLPAYCFDVENIKVQHVDNRNFTMRDIGALHSRIKNLEYYNSRQQLELESQALSILDPQGLPMSKNGTFVEDFRDHTKSNLADQEHRIVMDPKMGVGRCPYEMNHLLFEKNPSGDNTGIKENTNTLTLAFTEVDYINQPKASMTINVQPYNVVVWEGQVSLSPSSDIWIDTVNAPNFIVENEQVAASAFNSLDGQMPSWGAWDTSSSDRRSARDVVVDPITVHTLNGEVISIGGESVEGNVTPEEATDLIRNSLFDLGTIPAYASVDIIWIDDGGATTTTSLGESVIDVSLVPYIRENEIVYTAVGMKPDTTVKIYLDDIDISANCTNLVTDSNGDLTGTYSLQAATWRVGDHKFVIKDHATEYQTIASTLYFANGLTQTKQETVLVTHEDNINTTTERVYVDPVAQSFIIDEELTGGLYLSSIETYFSNKDPNEPITLYIVENDNGLPNHKKVVPYSMVTLAPASVEASYKDPSDDLLKDRSDDSTLVDQTTFLPTKFTFSDPVFLKHGIEYSFILLTNSKTYEVYASNMGDNDIITDAIIDKQPYLGSLFKSQNTFTWTPDQNKDIHFKINRCSFSNTANYSARPISKGSLWTNVATYVLDDIIIYDDLAGNVTRHKALKAVGAATPPTSFETWTSASDTNWKYIGQGEYDSTMVNFQLSTVEHPLTSITKKFTLPNDATIYNFLPFKDNNLNSRNTSNIYDYTDSPTPDTYLTDFVLSADALDVDNKLTPVIKRNEMGLILVNNLTVDIGGGDYDAGTYVAMNTVLRNESANIRVLLDTYTASTSDNVNVFVKTGKYKQRYADTEPSRQIQDVNLKDNICYIYQFDDPLTATAKTVINTSFVYKSKCVVDGITLNSDTSRYDVYVSSIEDPTTFAEYSATNATRIITTEPGILKTELFVGTTTTQYEIGEYQIYNNQLFKCLKASTGVIPTDDGTDWELIPMMFLNVSAADSVIKNSDAEWITTNLLSTIPDDFDPTKDFIENEYEPEITPSNNFTTFSVKVEMECTNPAKVPMIRKLRAIATK